MKFRLLLAIVPCAAGALAQTITGDITVAKALRALYEDYDEAKGTATSSDGIVSEYAHQEGMIDGKRVWFLYTTANHENNNCHACTVVLSGAMFEKEGSNWVNKENTRLAEIGSNGYARDCNPVKWGTQAYGLIVNDGWMGYGQLTSFQTLWGYENGSFKQIFTIPIIYNDSASLLPADEQVGWEMEWSFGPANPKGIFDVILKIKQDDPRARTAGAKKRGQGIPSPGVFRYDGDIYRNIRTQAELGK